MIAHVGRIDPPYELLEMCEMRPDSAGIVNDKGEDGAPYQLSAS
jgi:hypothetical protein